MYENPFIYKRPLYPGRDDCVTMERRKLLDKAISSLRFGQWLSVCCGKKTGKTSFLLRLIHECRALYPEWHFITLRAQDFLQFSLDELQQLLLAKVTSEMSMEPCPAISAEFENRELQYVLSTIGENLADGRRIVILLDGLENAPKHFVQAVFRELFDLFHTQNTVKTLARFQFVIAGSLAPNELRLDNGLSFSELATKTFLDDFPYEDVENMIAGAAKHYELPCEDGFARLLYEMTSGTGYLVQKICYKILETAFLRRVPPEFTLKTGEEAIDRIVEESETNVELIISQIEKKNSLIDGLIRTMRNGVIASYKLDPDLQALVSMGALSYRNGKYRLRNQIFEKILREYFTAERLANRYYSQKHYHRAKELFFDAIIQQDNAKNTLESLLTSIEAIGEKASQPDFAAEILKVFAGSVEGVQNCSLFLLDKNDNKLRIAEALGLSADIVANFALRYGEGVAGLVAQTGRARVVRDVTDEVECPEFVAREMAQNLNVGTMISLPLQIRGEVLGVISVCLHKPHAFTQSETKMLEILAAQASIALQNRPLHQSIERHKDHLIALGNTIQSLDTHIDSVFVFEEILKSAQVITKCEKTYIVCRDKGGHDWHFEFPADSHLTEGLHLPDVVNGEGVAGVVLTTGAPYLVSNVHDDVHYFPIWEDVSFEYGVPVITDAEIVGCLAFAGSDLTAFSDIQRVVLSILANLTGLAIKKQRLYGIAEKKTQQVISLKTIGEVLKNEKREDELLNLIAKECLKVVGRANKAAVVLLIDKARDKLVVKAARGEDFGKTCLGKSFSVKEPYVINRVLELSEAYCANDLQNGSDVCGLHSMARSEISVPVIFHGETLGVIDIQSTEPGSFDSQDQESLIAVANNAAVAIKISDLCNKRLIELDTLYRIGTRISSSLNAGDTLQTICKEALDALGNETRNVSLQILHPEDQSRVTKIVHGNGGMDANPSKDILERNGALKWVVENKRHLLIPNVLTEQMFVPQNAQTKSAALVPIIFDERLIAVITMESMLMDDFGEDELKLLQGLASQAGVALENARLSQNLAKTQMKLSNELEAVAIEEALAGLVHDIKNISTQIAGETHWLHKCEKENRIDFDQVRSAIQKIDTYVKNVEELTEKIRNRTYKLPPDLKPVNLRDLIEEASELASVKASGAKVDIHWAKSQVDIEIHVDAGRLVRAFFNIMTNAIDAMPDGGLLMITVRKNDVYVEVDFADTGEGIEPGILNKVLNPFFTSKQEGYGLGLAITKHIIEVDHQGKLRLQSTPGQGTTVTVHIPVSSNHHDNCNPKQATSINVVRQPQRIDKQGKSNKRILVVNDEKGMLEKIKRCLRNAGYKVTATEYGKKALGFCRTRRFDAIILDYHLKKDESPTQTAFDFLPEMRQTLPVTPIVLISASLLQKPSNDHQYDHFLPIDAAFWDKIVPLIHKCSRDEVEFGEQQEISAS